MLSVLVDGMVAAGIDGVMDGTLVGSEIVDGTGSDGIRMVGGTSTVVGGLLTLESELLSVASVSCQASSMYRREC